MGTKHHLLALKFYLVTYQHDKGTDIRGNDMTSKSAPGCASVYTDNLALLHSGTGTLLKSQDITALLTYLQTWKLKLNYTKTMMAALHSVTILTSSGLHKNIKWATMQPVGCRLDIPALDKLLLLQLKKYMLNIKNYLV